MGNIKWGPQKERCKTRENPRRSWSFDAYVSQSLFKWHVCPFLSCQMNITGKQTGEFWQMFILLMLTLNGWPNVKVSLNIKMISWFVIKHECCSFFFFFFFCQCANLSQTANHEPQSSGRNPDVTTQISRVNRPLPPITWLRPTSHLLSLGVSWDA